MPGVDPIKLYVTNTQAYQRKPEKFFVSEEKKSGHPCYRSSMGPHHSRNILTTCYSNEMMTFFDFAVRQF